MIHYKKSTSNIVTLSLDMENRKSNIINHEIGRAFIPVLNHLKKEKAKDALAGVIITSSKRTFLTGGDLDYLYATNDADAIFSFVEKQKTIFRVLETLGVPIVAAINGAALGSGYELALAAHHRIALEHPKTYIGLPEATLGILPGGGGVIKLTWLLGLEKAFPLLAEGKRLLPKQALEAGLIDDIAETKEELMEKARLWIEENPDATQPWDKPNGRIHNGTPKHPKVAQMVAVATASLLKKTRGNYPAPQAILNTMVEGAIVDFESALRIESRYFTQLLLGKVSRNMTKAFWYDLNSIKAGKSRPKGFGKFRPQKIGIIGAGMMGSGIAYVSAMSGLEVVLKDVSTPIAERGKAYSEKLLTKQVAKGKISEADKALILKRILPTEQAADFEGCDLVIEAVFENRSLKARVTKEAEQHLDQEAIFASNTSTLPITGLAKESTNPDNYIGLHFFSPVEKMALVEIIVGEKTSKETLARAFDFVKKIRKTPIVVNDSRGFYTSRVFGTYVMEGMALLKEGHLPNMIEQAGLQAGMPMGPLALIDEVSLSLINDIQTQEKKAYEAHPGLKVVQKMVKEFKRPGKSKGAGFYEYPKGGKKYLWPDLVAHFQGVGSEGDFEEMKERLMIIQSLESVRCYFEKVVVNVADVNIGSIYGWGFAPFKGGTLQYINDFGLSAFVNKADKLAKSYGKRFTVPDKLREMAENGEVFT